MSSIVGHRKVSLLQVNRNKSSVEGYKTLLLRVKQLKVTLIQVNNSKSIIREYKMLLSRAEVLRSKSVVLICAFI